MSFSEGATTLGTATLSGGIATISVNNLGAGSHTVTASYAGDANNPPASDTTGVLITTTVNSYTWQYGYDAMGRVNTVIDPNNQASYHYYDALGRRIQTQQPGNTVTAFGWDLQDSLSAITDPRSLTTSYTPDGLGNVKAESSPDRGSLAYTFDAKGNVLSITDARGKTTSYTYDALDRLTKITYASGTPTTFEYDGGATPTPAEAGELTKITDESGSTTYVHDAMGRLITKTVVIAGKTFTVGYAWGDSGSALDKLTGITYPSGSVVNYSYDQFGSISGITVTPAGGSTQTLLSNITYNVDNNVTGWLWSDGKQRTIGYDANGMIASYTLGDPTGTGNQAGTVRTLTRDSAGRITGYTHSNGQSQLDQGFTYDALDRLTSQTVSGTSYAYTYDANGNRTSKIVGGNTYTNTVAANSNRYTQTQDVNGTVTPQYDAAGNTTSDGVNTYAYSDRGRMSGAGTPSGNLTLLYSGLDLRALKTSASGTTYYVYSEIGTLLGENDDNGNPIYETIYFGAVPVGVIKQGVVYNVYSDQSDTSRVVTKLDHTIVWRWDTAEAFGATAPSQDPSGLGTFVFNQRFPGQVFDAETALFDNWYRQYCARCGRYAQIDPLGLGGGINPILYVGANPVTGIDPRGLFDPTGFAGAGGVATAAGATTGTSAVVAGAAVGGAAVVGVGFGLGFNKAWEYFTGNTVGGSVYDTFQPDGDYSPWSPAPEKNKEFTRDRDAAKAAEAGGPPKRKDPNKPTCDELRDEIMYYDRAIAARKALTNKWYGGQMNPGHQKYTDNLQKDRDRLQRRLDRGDCTPC